MQTPEQHPDEAIDTRAYALVDKWHKRGYIAGPWRAMMDYDIAELIREAQAEAALAAAPRWIPVGERLPDVGVLALWRSLLTGEYCRGTVYRDPSGEAMVAVAGGSGYSVNFYSHWLPLPPDPAS